MAVMFPFATAIGIAISMASVGLLPHEFAWLTTMFVMNICGYIDGDLHSDRRNKQ